MRYDKDQSGIWLESEEDLEVASWVLFASHSHDDPKEKKIKPDPVRVSLPWFVTAGAMKGLMHSMERAANGETSVTPDIRALAQVSFLTMKKEIERDQNPGIMQKLGQTLSR